MRYVPIGPSVGLVPWNFPITLGMGKLLPALLAGNTFIWKSSPFSPYTALKLAELGAKIFPPGVFQALSGAENLGPMLTSHPDIAKVSFTGSVETGKKVAVACTSTLKRVTLELGGNDAAIICDDVDIDAIVGKVSFSPSFFYQSIPQPLHLFHATNYKMNRADCIPHICACRTDLHDHQAHIRA